MLVRNGGNGKLSFERTFAQQALCYDLQPEIFYLGNDFVKICFRVRKWLATADGRLIYEV